MILGLSVGVFTGLAQVVLKDAWLTVLDGFRPGRQLILSQASTLLGRGDHLPLPFLGYSGRDLENEHLRISRQADGSFLIEDNRSRAGTLLNGQRLERPTLLHDGDLIRLGGNIVRFNHRQRTSAADSGAAARPMPAIPARPLRRGEHRPLSPSITPPAQRRQTSGPSAAQPALEPPVKPQLFENPPQGTPSRIPPPPPPPGVRGQDEQKGMRD